VKHLIALLLLAVNIEAETFTFRAPSTTNNDDSCDVSVAPAATLLLPYFEVDISGRQSTARTTTFSVINTSRVSRVARVTLWTDLARPVLNFNLFLTPYDVQSINLYDVLALGVIAPPSGFSPADCQTGVDPLSPAVLQDVRTALTTGRASYCGASAVGLTHANAIGFATIDLVNTCEATFPTDPAYYDDLLFDNVLTGDYEWIDPNPTTGNYASGNPLVHIRAIPEGGPAGGSALVALPYTFYDRYTPRTTPKMDRRQPLPSAFAARFIQGGTGAFNTELRIWREGVTGASVSCSAYQRNGLTGTEMTFPDIVRFDEHENPTIQAASPIRAGPPQIITLVLPAASSVTASSAGIVPPLSTSGDVGGWIYLNLNNKGSSTYSVARHSQNWTVVWMYAEGRFSWAGDAAWLANGCSPPPVAVTSEKAPIAPGP